MNTTPAPDPTTKTATKPALKTAPIEQHVRVEEITTAAAPATPAPLHQEATPETDTRTGAGTPPTSTAATSGTHGRETRMNSTQTGLLAKPNKKKKRPATRRRHSLVLRNPEELESELREAYFSAAGWVAMRYEVEN